MLTVLKTARNRSNALGRAVKTALDAAAFVTLLAALLAAPASAQVQPAPAEKGRGFAFRDTADGVSCKVFDTAIGLAWPGERISWLDADGKPGGPKGFDVQILVTSGKPPGLLRWNVLPLVQAWGRGAFENEGLVVSTLNPTSGGGADFYSREAVDVSVRPSLRLQYANGSTEFLTPTADAHLDCSTYSPTGPSPSLRIGPGSPAVLRFDLARLRKGTAAQAVAAELILVRQEDKKVWSTGDLAVFRVLSPWAQKMQAVPKGLASAFRADAGIEDHPAVLWADGFANGKLRNGWKQAVMVKTKAAPPLAAAAPLGQLMNLPSLHSVIPKGENLGLDLRFDLPGPAQGADQPEAYMRYYLRLGPEWAANADGGKLPGFGGTYNRVGWGGRGWDGKKGWSARGAFTKALGANHPVKGLLPLASYVYHSKISSAYGDSFVWAGSNGAALLEPNRWYCIEQHIKMNTLGKEDGVLRAWVDGKPVFEKFNFRFRDVADVGIENAWFNVYMGGAAPALQDMHVNIAKVVVATGYIGPMAP